MEGWVGNARLILGVILILLNNNFVINMSCNISKKSILIINRSPVSIIKNIVYIECTFKYGDAIDLLMTGQVISHFVAGHHRLSSVHIQLINTNSSVCAPYWVCYMLHGDKQKNVKFSPCMGTLVSM